MQQSMTIAAFPDDTPHILVVDDDTRLRDLLRKFLTENRFRVTTASDAADARAKLQGLEFDLIVLDVMMPGENGLEFTSWLRRTSDVPVLMLTAMGEPDDRINGLEHGVDDYLVKPFEPRELLLRIGTILRRTNQPAVAPRSSIVAFGACVFDLDRQELKRDGTIVHLTEAERDLLKTLAVHRGVTLTRDDLLDLAGIDGGVRSVDVQVTRLRRKVEVNPKAPRFLLTVRGKGYVLRPE